MDGDRAVIPRNGKSNWVKRCGRNERSKIRQDKRQWSESGMLELMRFGGTTTSQEDNSRVCTGSRRPLGASLLETRRSEGSTGAGSPGGLEHLPSGIQMEEEETPKQHWCLEHRFQLRKEDGHWMIFDFIFWGGWLHFRVIRQDGLNPKKSLWMGGRHLRILILLCPGRRF